MKTIENIDKNKILVRINKAKCSFQYQLSLSKISPKLIKLCMVGCVEYKGRWSKSSSRFLEDNSTNPVIVLKKRNQTTLSSLSEKLTRIC